MKKKIFLKNDLKWILRFVYVCLSIYLWLFIWRCCLYGISFGGEKGQSVILWNCYGEMYFEGFVLIPIIITFLIFGYFFLFKNKNKGKDIK